MFIVSRGQTFGTPLGVRCQVASEFALFRSLLPLNIALLKECLIRCCS